MIQIKHRHTEKVLFECEIPEGISSDLSIRHALEKATEARANLDGAYLAGAYLAGAYLAGANLDGANLARANLDGAYLDGANLAGATLDGAYLDGANLDGANLAGAYLARANLDGANLDGAYLDGANLARAYLDGAYLDGEELTKTPISILNLEWNILITEGFMRIGCQRHSHKEWEIFQDNDIAIMHNDALEFWKVWKKPLLMMCEKHRGAS